MLLSGLLSVPKTKLQNQFVIRLSCLKLCSWPSQQIIDCWKIDTLQSGFLNIFSQLKNSESQIVMGRAMHSAQVIGMRAIFGRNPLWTKTFKRQFFGFPIVSLWGRRRRATYSPFLSKPKAFVKEAKALKSIDALPDISCVFPKRKCGYGCSRRQSCSGTLSANNTDPARSKQQPKQLNSGGTNLLSYHTAYTISFATQAQFCFFLLICICWELYTASWLPSQRNNKQQTVSGHQLWHRAILQPRDVYWVLGWWKELSLFQRDLQSTTLEIPTITWRKLRTSSLRTLTLLKIMRRRWTTIDRRHLPLVVRLFRHLL